MTTIGGWRRTSGGMAGAAHRQSVIRGLTELSQQQPPQTPTTSTKSSRPAKSETLRV